MVLQAVYLLRRLHLLGTSHQMAFLGMISTGWMCISGNCSSSSCILVPVSTWPDTHSDFDRTSITCYRHSSLYCWAPRTDSLDNTSRPLPLPHILDIVFRDNLSSIADVLLDIEYNLCVATEGQMFSLRHLKAVVPHRLCQWPSGAL